MSSNHMRAFLENLKQYDDSEISLNLNDINDVPLLSVCFKDNNFEVKYENKNIVNKYDDVDNAISDIDKFINDSSQETSD